MKHKISNELLFIAFYFVLLLLVSTCEDYFDDDSPIEIPIEEINEEQILELGS